MECNKKPLTKEGAIAALAIIGSRRNNKKADKKPCRKYYCTECEAWHLTAETMEQHYGKKKKKALRFINQ